MKEGSAVGHYVGDEIDVEFSCFIERHDCGVSGSPVWGEPIDSSIKIESIQILGVEVDVDSLPKDIVGAIYELSNNVEWEIDE